MEAWIGRTLRELSRPKLDTIMRRRYERLRNYGSAFERVESATIEAEEVAPRPRRRTTATVPAR